MSGSGRHERAAECQRDKRLKKKTLLFVHTFILCLLKFFFQHTLRLGEEELSY